MSVYCINLEITKSKKTRASAWHVCSVANFLGHFRTDRLLNFPLVIDSKTRSTIASSVSVAIYFCATQDDTSVLSLSSCRNLATRTASIFCSPIINAQSNAWLPFVVLKPDDEYTSPINRFFSVAAWHRRKVKSMREFSIVVWMILKRNFKC